MMTISRNKASVTNVVLPQPEEAHNRGEFVPIPKNPFSKHVPFGYKIDPDNTEWLLPIEKELQLMEQAKKHLKKYSYREVAAWLSTQSGRSITFKALQVRIKNEQSNGRKASLYRKLARQYERYIKTAQEYEEKVKRFNRRFPEEEQEQRDEDARRISGYYAFADSVRRDNKG